jgi:hypothetical protein
MDLAQLPFPFIDAARLNGKSLGGFRLMPPSLSCANPIMLVYFVTS